MPFSEVKAHLSEIADRVEGQHERILVTRDGRPSFVLMSPDDLESIEESLDILKDAALMEYLRSARHRRGSTGLVPSTLTRMTKLDLLDSALHAPQTGFGEVEFYPEFVDKAAVLAVRIAKNHPCPAGNKRLAWQALTMFCALNGRGLEVPTGEVVETMVGIAGGDLDELAVARWLSDRISDSI